MEGSNSPHTPEKPVDFKKSIRQLPKLEVKDDAKGEALPSYSDHEWDASEEPFAPELLNVKKTPNRISVFTGPYRQSEIELHKKDKNSSGKFQTIDVFHSSLQMFLMMIDPNNSLRWFKNFATV
ncbi:unnamed protein product [Caenorhabditis bovis]|uniref:Uncharacterized protein n=1 Tax=Caenorhabditis bovis TaxID=2654633 RepID=A0A8S1EMF8_9PELO|nr:unnamed protein product [Caenorhabditis bovis]